MSSPSAVAKVKGCARQFALNLFEPYVQGKEAALGDEVHDAADDYQKFGKAPISDPKNPTTAGLMLEPGLPYMPHPRTGNAEGKVRWTFEGLTHNFRMDLNGFVRDLPGALAGTDPNMPYVLDYKTQKDKDGREKDQQLWGKAAFLADEEAVLYALRRMVETNYSYCYLRWLYLRGPNADGKLRPRARPSDVIVTWAEVLDAYRRMYAPYARVVDGIYQARDKKHLTVLSAMSLPPNPHQCTRYGKNYPCSHMDKCQLSSEFVLIETSKEENYAMQQLQGNDLFAAMQAAMGAAPAMAATLTGPAQPQAPANPAPVVNPAAFSGPVVTSPIPAVAQQPVVQHGPMAGYTAPAVVPPGTVLTMPSAPAFVNPPEAPHVPASTGPAFVVEAHKDHQDRMPDPTDAEIGRVVRFLFGR